MLALPEKKTEKSGNLLAFFQIEVIAVKRDRKTYKQSLENANQLVCLRKLNEENTSEAPRE